YRSLSWSEVEDTVRMINEADPDYVWVGLGSPKQDQWLATFRPLLHAPVLLAVGAAFDFHAGKLTRAPRWAQRAGLEWLFRLAGEPRRLAWRYAQGGGRFGMLLFSELLNRRKVTE
ncbi:MAG TPA: WecB/TagA/CpsF family glycosyltransferase, partial [Dehalococcoidia bacterium]|nr:WecB/TagA/CpsF family glycosyltransferase [Dehalococcoidia bacterium]